MSNVEFTKIKTKQTETEPENTVKVCSGHISGL